MSTKTRKTAAEKAAEAETAAGTLADAAPLEPPTADAPITDEQIAADETPDPTPEVPPLADPASVVLEAPPAPADDADAEEEEPEAITPVEAEVKKLALSTHEVCDKHGNLVDPETAFSERTVSGQRQSLVRLYQNQLVSEFKRPVRTLVIAEGVWVPDAAAVVIVDRLRAAKAAAEAAEQD